MNESTNNLLPMRFDNKEIDEHKPWGDDALERYKFADILTDRVKNGISPYTISVNGGWGTGKTFLLQRWRQQLKNDKYKAIYYNAWEDDFCVNPLVSIIGQIATEIKDPIFKSLIANIIKNAVPLAIEKSLNYINLTKKELQSEIKNTLNTYSEHTAQIKALKESLETLTTKIEGATGHPLIFIIDELDRCRPTFAIEVLERIKHLFNIPGIIFVLGMNRIELEKSIKHVYGDIKSEEYLRRFYDIDLTLSAPKSSNYYRYLINNNKNALSSLIQEKNYEADLFDYLDISLRDTEHCFRVLCFILNTKISYDKRKGWAAACLIIILLRIQNSDLYWDFIQGKSSSIEVINYICKSTPDSINNMIGSVDTIIIKEICALAKKVEWDNINQAAQDQSPHTNSFSTTILNSIKKPIPDIQREGNRYFDSHHGDNALKEIASLLDLVER